MLATFGLLFESLATIGLHVRNKNWAVFASVCNMASRKSGNSGGSPKAW